jgi:hypothetical protein
LSGAFFVTLLFISERLRIALNHLIGFILKCIALLSHYGVVP